MVEEEEKEKEVVEEKVTQSSHENIESSPKNIKNQMTEEDEELSSENVTGDIVGEELEKDIEKAAEIEHKTGVLEVKVNEAKELENKAMLGKSDPYVFIQFEDSKFQSQTVNSNLAPKWSFSTDLNISEYNTNCCIQFSVFDDNYGKDQLLGS